MAVPSEAQAERLLGWLRVARTDTAQRARGHSGAQQSTTQRSTRALASNKTNIWNIGTSRRGYVYIYTRGSTHTPLRGGGGVDERPMTMCLPPNILKYDLRHAKEARARTRKGRDLSQNARAAKPKASDAINTLMPHPCSWG